jgi:raffinose/stachyose/melibiose transport system permease protein
VAAARRISPFAKADARRSCERFARGGPILSSDAADRIKPRSRTAVSKQRRSLFADQWMGLLLIGPSFILFGVYIGFPIVFNFIQSFQVQNYYGTSVFSGLKNYSFMLQDPVFWSALRNNLIWFILTIGVQTILGFLFALLYEAGIIGRQVMKTVLFTPVVLSPVVVGYVWDQIYNPNGGLIAGLLQSLFNVSSPDWLGNPHLALYSVIITNIWQWTGFSMLLYIAALQNIPEDLKEAARVDGATSGSLVRHIVIPLLRGTTGTILILGLIGSLQTFALVYIMTGGGPANSSHVLGTYIFQQAFTNVNYGYGSALSVVLLLLTLILTLVQLRFFSDGGANTR